MKVAVVTTSYPEGEDDPSGHFVRAEVRQLELGGDEVNVICARGEAFGWPGVASRLTARPRLLPGALREIWRMRQRLLALGARRVIAHWAVPCALPIAWNIGSAGAGTRDSELEVVSHGGDVRLLMRLPGPVRSACVRVIARRATRWRFASHALLDGLLSTLSRDARTSLVTCAVVVAPTLDIPLDLLERHAEKKAARRPAFGDRQTSNGGPETWVAVARLVPSKRVERAIAEAARAGVRLVVVGDGPERAYLEATAKARCGDVRFVGAVGRREALSWIASADALVHASLFEGLSTVVREAEALGTRVVLIT